MGTKRVTISIDEGVYRDAVDAAAEHGMSVSAWIAQCTRNETMRAALAAHRDWCANEGLTGEAHSQREEQRLTGTAAEYDRLNKDRRQGTDAA